ncbi:glycerate kinase, partial [Staphylococcus hyicus]
ALEAANAREQGLKRVFNEDLRWVKLPMADGGEGRSQTLHEA